MRRSSHILIATAIIAATAAPTLAQQARNAAAPPPSPAAAKPRADDNKKAMTVADYARWRTIRDAAITDDGVWASYGYSQRRVDDTLFVKNLSTGAEQKIPRASRSQFSDDSKWVAYFVAEPQANAQQGGDNAPPPDAEGGGGRGGQPTGPARLELRNLAAGTVTSWDNVASFAFSKASNALMVRKARAGAAPDPAAGRGGRGGAGGGRGGRGGAAAPPAIAGTDMIVHHLRDGMDELVGSVSAAEFNKGGSLLAYTVSSTDRDGNGLYIESIGGSWQRRSLDNERADYARLTWDDSGTAVAALRGMARRGFTEKENGLVAFAGLDGAEPASYVLERKNLTGLADTMVISEKGTLSWSPDRSKVFIGLKEQEAQQRRDTTVAAEPIGNVDVWHWKDPYIQSVQMVRAQQDRNRTFVATVILAQKKVVPLADTRMDRVQVAKNGNWAIGQDDKDYIDDSKPQLIG